MSDGIFATHNEHEYTEIRRLNLPCVLIAGNGGKAWTADCIGKDVFILPYLCASGDMNRITQALIDLEGKCPKIRTIIFKYADRSHSNLKDFLEEVGDDTSAWYYLQSILDGDESHPLIELSVPEEIKAELQKHALDFPDIMAGVAGEFAKILASYLEAPEHFFYMAYLTCLGSLVAGKLLLVSEVAGETRIYLLILGDSADARKSTAIDKTVAFFRSNISDFNVCYGLGSAEGLQKILADKNPLLLYFDEFRAFTSKCKIDSSVLMPAVTTLFESKLYESHTAKKSISIADASLSMLAASTVETYEQIFDEHFLSIGFPNRIFLCPGSGDRRFSLPNRIPEYEWKCLGAHLGEVLQHIDRVREINITLEARRIYHDWYLNLPQSVHAKRLETYSMRLMPLLAVNELKDNVDEEIIQKVIQLMDWQYRVRCRYDPIDADSLMARTEEKIRRTLITGPKTKRDIYREVHANRIGIWVFESALTNLVKAGQITALDKGKTYKLIKNDTTLVTGPLVTQK